MGCRSFRKLLAVGLGSALGLVLAYVPSEARAQYPWAPTSATAAPPTASGASVPSPTGFGTMPLANPLLNSLVNPSGPQTTITPGTAALYLFSAQAANGGLGSGRLSGVRPAAGSTGPYLAAGAARLGSKEQATSRSANTPGAGASHYFNRNFATSAGPPAQYNRQVRQHPGYAR